MTATETKKPLRQASWLDGRAMWLAIPVVGVLILTALRKLPQRPPSQALLDHTVLVPPETRSSPYVVGSSVEARAALRQALEMKHAGKRTKAQRLFLHALHMEPDSPDILNEYGMFLEEEQEVLQADRLYTRALALAPCHHGALDNRVRTSTVVEGIDRQQLDSIDNKVKRLLSIPPGSFVLRRVARESYYQHVYHTVALEGNTLSLPEIRRILQTRRAVCGRSLSEQNEVLGIDAAMTFINATLAAHLGPVTPLDILEIHRRVLGPVDPVEAGRFRRGQVYVGRHIPPPADAVPGLVEELTQWLASEEAASLHPVELGALSHYRLVYIHPFNDGNGRTARLLMNFLLMQAEYPPVTVRAEQRAEYYATLEAANAGDVRPFIRFVGRCAEATLDRYLVAVSRQPRSALSGDGMVESGLPLSNPISAVLVQN